MALTGAPSRPFTRGCEACLTSQSAELAYIDTNTGRTNDRQYGHQVVYSRRSFMGPD